MNALRVRHLAMAGFAFFVLGLSSLPAEIKLRIYLQDGSLQSGNLVTETPESFVILTKEGRSEIPKKNIMFINGKTLKQWQDRPDKLFQTEIIPTEIPNPAFVNDKAPLPRPPEIKSVQPPPPPVESKPVVQAPAVVAPPPPAPPVAPAVVPQRPAGPKPAEPRARPERRTKAARARKATQPVPEAAPAPEVVDASRRTVSRRLKDRAIKGASHRVRGFAFIAQGEKGRATQELLIARLLEPDNGDTYLALGRLYREAGLNDAALKFFSHWTLRKSEAANQEITGMQAAAEQAKRARLYLQIGTAAGALAWVPAVLLIRSLRRRRASRPAPAPEVPVAEAPTPEADWVQEAEAAFTPPPPVAETPAIEVLPLAAFIEDEPVEEPVPVIEEKPAVPAARPPEPEPEVVKEFVPEPEPEPEPEPVVAEPVMPAPVPVAAAAPDPNEILAMARFVENALVLGNAAAVDGKIDEARKCYRTALAFNSSCATAHLGLGYLAFLEQKWEASLAHYRKALEIDPGSADAHYGAARVLLEIDRLDDAVPELRAALTLDPTYDDARDALTAIGKPA